MINENIYSREKVPKYTKYTDQKGEAKHLVKYQKQKEYDYYKCDYCNDEIKIIDKKYEMTGGIVKFPDSLTRKGDLKLALCNKCLKSVLKEFEERL